MVGIEASAAQQYRDLRMADDNDTDSTQPPAKLPRLSSADANAGTAAVAASSPLVLGLGLGLGSSDGSREREAEPSATARSALTFMQQQELEHQVLIFRYLAAGAPVPVHLVLPIWKSVAASSSSFGPQRFPSLTGLGSLCFDYRNSMDPEPGRCRRTDGKKWRCSREVVPSHKYCERHVHRGRGRSRKPVEAAAASASAGAPAPNAAVHQPAGLGFSPASVLLAHNAARAT